MGRMRFVLLVGMLAWGCGTGSGVPAHGGGSGGSANGGAAGVGTAGSAGFPAAGGSSTGSGGSSGGAGGTTGGTGGTSSGGSGGALPCDSRFSFSSNPATAGVPFQVHFTDSPGYVYVDMHVTGPGTPKTAWVGVSGTPHTWTWTVSGHGAGVLDFTFVKNANGTPGTPVASCQIQSNPGSGSGGSGGTTGSGGTGGTSGSAGTGGSGGGPVGNCTDQAKRNRFAMNIDPANPGGNPSAAQLRAIGARWARIEWKQGISHSLQQSQIAALRSGGVRVMLLVDYASVSTPSPGSSGSASAWSSYDAEYINVLSNLVSTYGTGIDAWEIWNEPDLAAQPGYDPHVPPATFGQMLKDASSTVHAKSSAPVVVGGLASGDPSYLTQVKSAVGGLYADAIGIHPYGQRAPDGWPNSSWGFGNMSTLFSNYLAFGKPLWLTEIGTNDSANQAQYLKNVYALAASYGSKVPEVFWFCWSDAMVSPFGVLDSSGNKKPAYTAYKSVAPAWDSSCE